MALDLQVVLARGSRTRRLFVVAAAVGGFCVAARMVATRLLVALLYHPMRYDEDPGHKPLLERFTGVFKRLAYRLEEVEYVIASGEAQRAILVHPEGPPSGGIWVVHGGNAMVGTDWLPFCGQLLAKLPADRARPAILLVDYPGYGANDGSPNPRSILATQFAAIRAALPRLAAPPGELHLLGHSLGAGAASQLATRLVAEAKSEGPASALASLKPGRLLLSAPFVSIEAMAQALFGKRFLPGWLVKALLTQEYKNSVWVPEAARLGWRTGVILGVLDQIVPPWMGKALSEMVVHGGGKCALVEVSHAGHNDLPISAFPEYAKMMGVTSQSSAL